MRVNILALVFLIVLGPGMMSCSENYVEEASGQRNFPVGLWELNDELGNIRRWAFVDDGNGQYSGPFSSNAIQHRSFTWLYDESNRILILHGSNKSENRYIITKKDSKSIIWQDVSNNYCVEKLIRLPDSDETKEDVLFKLKGIWKKKCCSGNKGEEDVFWIIDNYGLIYEKSFIGSVISSPVKTYKIEYGERTHLITAFSGSRSYIITGISSNAFSAANFIFSRVDSIPYNDKGSSTPTSTPTILPGDPVKYGQTYSYSGSATLECFEGTYEPMNYKSVAKGTAKLQVNLTSSNTGTLTIQGFNLDKASMSSITISGLVMTTNNNQSQTTLALGENSAFGQNDSFTYNGKTYPASNLYIEEATATSEQLKLKMTIYFGEGMTDAVNLIYSGQAVSE